jgi:hypothetical protein
MRLSGSRGGLAALVLLMVMLGAAFPQRAAGQWRAETLVGARFGPPLRAGFAVGVVYGNTSRIAQFAGPIALAEVGLGGGRVSAGYFLAFPFVSGVEALGSVVRTWGSPVQADANVTMVGGELRAIGFAVNVGLGIFRPIGGAEGDGATRYYMNIGLGI